MSKRKAIYIHQDKDVRLFLQSLHGDGDGDEYSNMMHMHRSRNEDENYLLYNVFNATITAQLDNVEHNYHYCTESFWELIMQGFFSKNHAIEAQHLATKLASSSRQVHGPRHKATIESETPLEDCRRRYVIIRTDPQNHIKAYFQAQNMLYIT